MDLYGFKSKHAQDIRCEYIGMWSLEHDHLELPQRSRERIITSYFNGIQEIFELLRNPSVRGHSDSSSSKPEVDDRDLSMKELDQKLKQQVRAACILADTVHQGPEANSDELAALTEVKEVLLRIQKEMSRAIRPLDTFLVNIGHPFKIMDNNEGNF